MFRNLSFFLVSLSLSITALGQMEEEKHERTLLDNTHVDKTVVVSAPEVTLKDEVETTPERVSIKQPRLAPTLNDSVQKLPGAFVTEFSGPGSQSAVIAPIATGSGGTLVSIDDVPILAPFGRGNDLVFYPPSFFNRLDWYSPFYPWTEGLTAPGGRLDLRTRTPKAHNQTEVSGSTLFGTANTFQLSSSAAGEDDKQSWLVGLTAFRTDGNYDYIDPGTKERKVRENNDNRYFGTLLKKEMTFENQMRLSLTGLGQIGHRTDPGNVAVGFIPAFGYGVGHDTLFGVGNIKLDVPYSYIENTSQRFTFSHMLNRHYYTNVPTFTLPRDGGENAQSDFFSYQLRGKTKRDAGFLQLDGMYEKIESYYINQTDRHFLGVTAGYDAIKLSDKDLLIPRVRGEQVSSFGFSPDGSLSYIHEFEPGHEIFASASALHKVPSLIALKGYLEGGMPITGLSTLPVERLEVYSLGYNLTGRSYGVWLTGWYSNHRDLAQRSSNNFVKVNSAQTMGLTANLVCGISDTVTGRVSAMTQKTKNNDTDKELTFKPSYVLTSSLNFQVTRELALGVEDVYEGNRYVSSTNSMSFEPINWTHLRADFKLGPGVLYAKVGNIFESYGYDNLGYPYPGRSYWIGYSL